MAAPDYVSYQILSIDGGLRSIAVRYRTTVEEIWEATYPRLRRKYHALKSAAELEQAVKPGDRIVLPFKGDNQDWVVCMLLKEPTLQELCVKKNAEPMRRSGMTLTPMYLWNHVLNAQLRLDVLTKLSNDDERRKLDLDPSQAKIAGLTAMIPYPIRPVLGAINAAPVTVGQTQVSGTVEFVPKWITDLARRLKGIQEVTDALRVSNDTGERVRREGMAACSTLVLMQKLLEILAAGTTHQPSLDALKGFEQKHMALLRMAVEKLYIAAPALILPSGEAQRSSQADELFQLVNDPELKKLCARAMSDSPMVDGVRMENRACAPLAAAYRELALSPRSEDAVKQMEQELKLVGLALNGAPPANASNALGVLASFAGTTTLIGGNLPGPSTLAVSCLHSVTVDLLPRLLRSPSGPEKGKALLDLLVKIAGFSAEETKKFEDVVLRGGVARADWKGNAEVRTWGTDTQFKEAAKDIVAKLQASTGWNSGVLLLNAFALFGAAQAVDDYSSVRWWANVSGCSLNAALAFWQTLYSLRPEEVLGRALAVAGPKVGVGAMVTVLVSGLVTLGEGVQTGSVKTGVVGGGQVLGAGTALLGFAISYPWVQVIGVAILVGVALYSNYEGFDELTEYGTKKVVLAQLQWLERHPTFGKALELDADLARAFKVVKDAAKADKTALFSIERSTEALQRLRDLGFKTPEIDLIAPPSLPFAPSIFWGVGGRL